MASAMRKFISKFFLVLLPVLLLSGALAGLAWHTGEALPIAHVVQRQQSDPTIIYGTSRLENIMPLKLATAAMRQPDVLILGSSRLLQMRDQFFTRQPDKVYNASGGGWQLGVMIQYYHLLDPENRPKIMILGLDQVWFNSDSNVNLLIGGQNPNKRYDFDVIRNASVAVMQSLLSGKLSLQDMLQHQDSIYHHNTIGLTALERSFGYRADGSLQQGLLIASRAMQDASLAQHITYFATTNAYNYVLGDRVRVDTLERLDAFLAELHDDGVMVLGVTAPYHYQIYDAMQESGEYTYIDKAVPMIEAIFGAYGFDYYYFDDLREYGAGYNDWYDGWHVTESNSLRMLNVIFQDHPELFADYVDIDAVQTLLDGFTNPMDVLGELPE